MKTHAIIFLSDIHYRMLAAESHQNLIIEAFIKDLEATIHCISTENRYCIIAGDLVYAGDSSEVYENFSVAFLESISKFIPLTHIYFIAGNHDLDRQIISDVNDINELIIDAADEENTDKLISENSIIKHKFNYFNTFAKSTIGDLFNPLGYNVNVSNKISCYLLNSALLSRGGLNGHIDSRTLKIDFSNLRKWVNLEKGKKRVLIMHHPLTDLTEYAQRELEILENNKDIDFIITGHTHDPNAHILTHQSGAKRISLPPLYESEHSINGYLAFIIDDTETPSEIIYREWSRINRKFMTGINISGEDNGSIKLKNDPVFSIDDIIAHDLQNSLNASMKSYSLLPTWVDRFCSDTALGGKKRVDTTTYDYADIIKSSENYYIEASGQFGLTCFGKYLTFRAWTDFKKIWAFIDFTGIGLSKIESELAINAHKFLGKQTSDIDCIILDDWSATQKNADKILLKINALCPKARIILLSHRSETQALKALENAESHNNFKTLYLKPLETQGIRAFVKNINLLFPTALATEDEILERLITDVNEMNAHRTPLTFLQLLVAYQTTFDKRPINRYKVLNNVLRTIFDNPRTSYYTDVLDDKDCTYILGEFVDKLFRNNVFYFTHNEISTAFSKCAEENFFEVNSDQLVQILIDNQIIILDNDGYHFRLTYWLYYFAAHRMLVNEEFKDFMLDKRKALYIPEIMEFYTGIDGQRVDILNRIVEEIKTLSQNVQQALGLEVHLNPYINIKWRLNEVITGQTQEELIENIKQSKLPEDIKDAIADRTYDPEKPYHQTITEVLDRLFVLNLINLSKSASRALRNSDFVGKELKQKVLNAIIIAWNEINDAILLMSPMLAKNGFGGIGGARFQLTDDFPKEYDECLFRIVLNVPYNIMLMYKDELFSDKMMPLLGAELSKNDGTNQLGRHIIAIMTCRQRAKNWREHIRSYIQTIPKNSYYLGDLENNLSNNYQTIAMNAEDDRNTLTLIKLCFVKHDTGAKNPSLATAQRVNKDRLPEKQDNLDEY